MRVHLKKQLGLLLSGIMLLMIIGVAANNRDFLDYSFLDYHGNQQTTFNSSLLETGDQTSFAEEIAFLSALPEQRSLIFEIQQPVEQKNNVKTQHVKKRKSRAEQQRIIRDNFKAYVKKLAHKYQVLTQFVSSDILNFNGKGIDGLSELQCMALNLYFEARGESRAGQQAVAHVVLNRANHRGFPKSVCGVVKQGGEDKRYRCQFTWWCDGRSDRPRNKRSWRNSVILAAQVLTNQTIDPTNGALWYHADYVHPYWRRSMEKGPKIGKHIFYLSKKSSSQSRSS